MSSVKETSTYWRCKIRELICSFRLRSDTGDFELVLKTRFLSMLLIAGVAAAPWLAATGAQAAQSERTGSERSQAKVEARERLKEVEKNRHEVQQRLRETRIKEQAALRKLRKIENQLNNTKEVLHTNEHNLQRTETKIKQCETKITQTKTQEESLSDEAGKRLREIYEGQRLGVIEMMFQVSSLQTLLDLFYYQERIAQMDRRLIDVLRTNATELAQKKNQLGTQKHALGDLVSEFAKQALQLGKEKSKQETVAERLRTQRAFYEQAERQLESESRNLERQIVDMVQSKSTKNMKQGSGTMSMPLKAAVTSPFGWRRHPIFGVRKFHTGVDLAGPNHSAIRAADDGSVLYSGWYGGYGKVVIVSHGKGMSTLYAHMSKTNVSPGQNIQKGDVVGYEGTTGFSTGPHLHFEVRVDGKPNNPLNYVR